MMRMLKRFIKDERGLESSEYALLLALICFAIILAIGALAGSIANRFRDTATDISTSEQY